MSPDHGAPARTESAVDNCMVWDGRPGHYEVWFVTVSHRESGSGFWFRYTISSPTASRGTPPYCQLWVACFDGQDPERSFAINEQRPIADLETSAQPFWVKMGEAGLEQGALRGALAGNGHQATWDLAFTPEERTVRTLPDWAYGTDAVTTKFLAPHFSVPLTGRITADGRNYDLQGDRGTQCHIWGRKYAHAYAWGHACHFPDDESTAIDVLSVRLKKGPVVLPRLTLVTLRQGHRLERLSQPWHLLVGQGEWRSGRFRFAATAPTVRVRGEFTARPDEMVRAEYTDPDGEPTFCHNTEVADLRLVIERRGLLSWWKEEASLLAPRMAHFEHVARDPDLAVRRRHHTIGQDTRG